MLKKVLLVVGVVLVGLTALVASRPSEFSVERSAVVNAPADVAFAQVNDFKKWEQWSPWAKLDPTMKTTYGGPEGGGVGASYAWTGNDDVGEGKMTILESKPAELVKVDLEFIKPFAAKNITTFHFAKEGEGTRVTWKMVGQNSLMGKAFSLVMNMDKMVGGDFEKGLADMKGASEAAHKSELDRAEALKRQAEAAAAQVAAPTP